MIDLKIPESNEAELLSNTEDNRMVSVSFLSPTFTKEVRCSQKLLPSTYSRQRLPGGS